jgi:hypothetical protein
MVASKAIKWVPRAIKLLVVYINRLQIWKATVTVNIKVQGNLYGATYIVLA